MGTEQSRGAPLKPLDDPTPLTGPTVDVGVRIGWLLRMARLTSPTQPAQRLGDMVTRLEWQGLRTSTSSLHRVETGAVRDDRVVAAYEAALALAPGSLRATVDIVCRSFPYSPVDRAPAERVTSPAAMSALHEPVLAGVATGGQWRDWARAMAQPGNIALPHDLAREQAVALLGELTRADGTAYRSRYDAVTTLRRSAWADVVLEAVQAVVADPHVQDVNNPASALGETFDDRARSWLVDLLADPREVVVQGAAIGLGAMAQAHGGPDFWDPVLDDVVERFNDIGPAGDGWYWLSHLLRLLPSETLALARPRLAHPPSPVGQSLRPEGRQVLVVECQRQAEEASAALGLPHQPLLARLLFEVVGDGRSSRSHTSAMLLATLPSVRRVAVAALVDLAETYPDPWLRARSASRVTSLVEGDLPARVRERLATSQDLAPRDLHWAAKDGVVPDQRAVRRVLADPRGELSTNELLLPVGWAGWPLLRSLVEEPGWPDEMRGGAAWWLRTGSRLSDPDPGGAAG